MISDTVLDIIAYGAWNGGTSVNNSIFENKGMFFKGNVPVTDYTIQERIGVRTRVAAPPDERIGGLALQNLLETTDIDPSRIKTVIGATNVGDDKYDPSPLVRYAFKLLKPYCPNAMVFDLYAGCPGFNVATELSFMLSLTGILNSGDLSIIIGAENIHRAKAFKPLDTSNIIFGDDAMVTALETKANLKPKGIYSCSEKIEFQLGKDLVTDLARKVISQNGHDKIDGIIVDNQLGKLFFKVPAIAARIQHCIVKQTYPRETSQGIFSRFGDAIRFYNKNVRSFAFDINTLGHDTTIVEKIARAYVESGKYQKVISIYLNNDKSGEITIHKGQKFFFHRPKTGIIDTLTQTHGCFGDYIKAIIDDGDIFGEMDGKGVFLYATRGARRHLTEILSHNKLSMNDIDLLIEHQANFAMIPLTLQQILRDAQPDSKKAVAEFIANKMVNNIHFRGNCSVVCMQRLPYDLQRGTLKKDTIQGYIVNKNTLKLKHAKLILYDSVGAGMTRSSILQRKK